MNFLKRYIFLRKKYSFSKIIKILSFKLIKFFYHKFMRYWVSIKPYRIRSVRFKEYYPEIEFFFTSELKNKYIKMLYKKKQIENIKEQGDKIVKHIFNLLGSGEVYLGIKIPWHSDFKARYEWKKEYYYDIQNYILGEDEYFNNNADVKVPWEISRFQHLPILGQAFWITNNTIYAKEFKEQFEDWIEKNPIGVGVNWACTMDVAIRIINFILAYFYFKDSKNIDDNFWNMFFNHLYLTGKFIEKNLECDANEHGNNHYLSNIAGLIWLGLLFRNFDKSANRWLKSGVNKLVSEMEYQVNEDGGNFESSISYHRLATEIFLTTTILAEKNGIRFPEWYKRRLEKMCEFIMDYTKPNGRAPQIGDADDGRLHILSGYGSIDRRDHRHILSVAGEYFGRMDMKLCVDNQYMDSIWINGKFTVQRKENDKAKFKAYEQSGYYIINNENLFMIIRCGKIGQKGNGGHDHNDQLSFELNINGEDIIIDPGSYVYSADKNLRFMFRSTSYHNISQVGSLEQNIIKNRNMFDMFKVYSCNEGICNYFNIDKNYVEFDGEIQIADTLIKYKRIIKINLLDKIIKIYDDFGESGDSSSICKSRLHLSNKISDITIVGKNAFIKTKAGIIKINSCNNIELEKGFVSESYGTSEEAYILSWNFEKNGNFIIQY